MERMTSIAEVPRLMSLMTGDAKHDQAATWMPPWAWT